MNAEISNFFRAHSKNTKLTKDEHEYIDNLMFHRSSPAKKILPIFPRATPLIKETRFSASNYSSASSTGLNLSRKRLEIFDNDLFRPLFSLTDEPSSVCNPTNDDQKNDDIKMNFVNETNALFNTEEFISRSPPRQMTDAAKELMASLTMNNDSYSIFPNSSKESDNIPSFEFQLPEKTLPEFTFDISIEKNIESIEKDSEYIFDFEISGYTASTDSATHFPDNQLPQFEFIID